MQSALELTSLTKIFEGRDGRFIAVKDVNLAVEAGEFVAILGHSGCGKSTVLSMVAGLEAPSLGGVIVDGRQTLGTGLERAVVFQTPSLMPWLTARQNVALAAAQRDRTLSRAAVASETDRVLELVGVTDVADQLPSGLSLGTQQCVALARALSLKPRFLLLDEPFSMLDSLTRFELQDILLAAWETFRTTVVLVTHDVDEALYLADRIVLMTDGPAATVGRVITLPFRRPRTRVSVAGDPEYHACRRQVIDFLEYHAHQPRPSTLDDIVRKKVSGQ